MSGGVIQEVYSDMPDVRVVLIDWDKGESPGDDYTGGQLAVQALSSLPGETRRAVSALTECVCTRPYQT